jgi:hypothetical protein
MEGSMAISPWQDIWLVVFRPTPLKNDGVKVSWDDDIPNNQYILYGKKMFQTTNQIWWFPYAPCVVYLPT